MNIQVTNGPATSKARSESVVAIDPNDSQRMVAASKVFRNLCTYDFTIGTVYSFDGGQTWHDSEEPPLLPGWTGTTDPALTWDDRGNVFLIGLAFNNPPAQNVIGIYAYISSDGGRSWSAPKRIVDDRHADKQWVAADNSPISPYRGRVYAAWGGRQLVFARTLDHGATWIGTGTSPAGSAIATAIGPRHPEINVAPDGTIYVVARTATEITMFVSNDGGDSFGEVTPPAVGITTLGPVFGPEGNFRVGTFPTASAGAGKTVVAAWADFREGVSRIYYALSNDGGATWVTGPSGQSILAGFGWPTSQQHFHPQIVFDSRGTLGCAFYEFGPKVEEKFLIDVYIAWLTEEGFLVRLLTDKPWDPAVGAPLAHGDPDVTFIGEYFGLDSSPAGFYTLWTDTRTGQQELFAELLYHRFGFLPVYHEGDPGNGIGGFDLQSLADLAFAFDYNHSGKLDHLVLYRPGTGAVSIVENRGGSFFPVYQQGDPGAGIGGYNLLSTADRAFAFDYDSSGKLDHLVLYRPGTGAIFILANRGGTFVPVYAEGDPGSGIGGYNLLSTADRGFAFDYDGSGKLDHLVFYRPGTGAIFILANRGGTFVPVYAQGDPGNGIGKYDLKSPADRAFAFDFDGSGKQDYLALYRPGAGHTFWIVRRGGGFAPVFHEPSIGGYDLIRDTDRAFAFDYDSSGKPDHLALYRPGTGTFWILKKVS